MGVRGVAVPYACWMLLRRPSVVVLRRTSAEDVRRLYEFEADPVANEQAGTKPRDWETFRARWEEILGDVDGTKAGVTPRVIVADGEVVGAVNVTPWSGAGGVEEGVEGRSIGYWVAREHWGRGIASRAVALMLEELAIVGGRAGVLYATAAGNNLASLRVLEKNGFTVIDRASTAETARCVARETVTLVRR